MVSVVQVGCSLCTECVFRVGLGAVRRGDIYRIVLSWVRTFQSKVLRGEESAWSFKQQLWGKTYWLTSPQLWNIIAQGLECILLRD